MTTSDAPGATPRIGIEGQGAQASSSPTSDRAARVVTGAAVAATILLAIGPGLVAVVSGGRVLPYDGAIAMGAVNAVIVAIYTYFTRQALDVPRRIAADQVRREAQLRDQERASLATALLAELSRLWGRLLAVNLGGGADSPAGFLVHAMLTKAIDRLQLFHSDTIEAVTALNVLVSDVEIGIGYYRDLRRHIASVGATLADSRHMATAVQWSAEQQTQIAELEHEINRLRTEAREMRRALGIRSVWALEGISRLVPLLRAEGGKMPAPPSEVEIPLNTKLWVPADPFPRLGGALRLNITVREGRIVDLGSDEDASAALQGQDVSARKFDDMRGVEAVFWYPGDREDLTSEEYQLMNEYIKRRRLLAGMPAK